MCPVAGRPANGRGECFARGRMVAHCLLVETPASGLVLVDTGIGSKDVADPGARLGKSFSFAMGLGDAGVRPAIAHVRALGFKPEDVRHLVVTHLDLDHAGGLHDFPWAKVHVHAAEKTAALTRPTLREKERYRPLQWAHGPHWEPYDAEGEAWNGFAAVRNLTGLPPEMLAIPLPGHTRGHACIAVQGNRGWLLHAGDAYFDRGSIEGTGAPLGLDLFERTMAILGGAKVKEKHRRLGEYAKKTDTTVFSAHDPDEFDRLAASPV